MSSNMIIFQKLIYRVPTSGSDSSPPGARHRVGGMFGRVALSKQGGELEIDPPRDAPALIDEG